MSFRALNWLLLNITYLHVHCTRSTPITMTAQLGEIISEIGKDTFIILGLF